MFVRLLGALEQSGWYLQHICWPIGKEREKERDSELYDLGQGTCMRITCMFMHAILLYRLEEHRLVLIIRLELEQ